MSQPEFPPFGSSACSKGSSVTQEQASLHADATTAAQQPHFQDDGENDFVIYHADRVSFSTAGESNIDSGRNPKTESIEETIRPQSKDLCGSFRPSSEVQLEIPTVVFQTIVFGIMRGLGKEIEGNTEAAGEFAQKCSSEQSHLDLQAIAQFMGQLGSPSTLGGDPPYLVAEYIEISYRYRLYENGCFDPIETEGAFVSALTKRMAIRGYEVLDTLADWERFLASSCTPCVVRLQGLSNIQDVHSMKAGAVKRIIVGPCFPPYLHFAYFGFYNRLEGKNDVDDSPDARVQPNQFSEYHFRFGPEPANVRSRDVPMSPGKDRTMFNMPNRDLAPEPFLSFARREFLKPLCKAELIQLITAMGRMTRYPQRAHDVILDGPIQNDYLEDFHIFLTQGYPTNGLDVVDQAVRATLRLVVMGNPGDPEVMKITQASTQTGHHQLSQPVDETLSDYMKLRLEAWSGSDPIHARAMAKLRTV
ncbi:uncharacterized protein HRG_11262 [Hirsutella rhossiliensis]|uniref:Uncharacterized protein n=1 Tax=Hirsutella rhossiliensis TaxID=111463 RepID=A0A9P8SE83_9HYPO|nr:uncharacterized protein HRG_11262 [Hirsutella rhossiliensis]KAH0957771.1 hypothetical protein HRG_11262 [Hirsutella rhossiliensis]